LSVAVTMRWPAAMALEMLAMVLTGDRA